MAHGAIAGALDAAHMRATVLAPFYERIQEDYNTIVQLRRKISDLEAHILSNQTLDQEHEIPSIQNGIEEPALSNDNDDKQESINAAVHEQVPAIEDFEDSVLADELSGAGAAATHDDEVQNSPLVSGAADEPVSAASIFEEPPPRAKKRKATAPPGLRGPEAHHTDSGRIFDKYLAALSKYVLGQMQQPLDNDTISEGGKAILTTLVQRPEDALRAAHKMLHSNTPAAVAPYWCRVFEDATMYLVAKLLQEQALRGHPVADTTKRVKLTIGSEYGPWLPEIVSRLDQAIMVAGAPKRRKVIDTVLSRLDPIAQRTLRGQGEHALVRGLPLQPLNSSFSILRPKVRMTELAFRQYIDRTGNAVRPLVLKDVMSDWPARNLWDDLSYLRRHTMAGHRLVSVEVGPSYTEPGWGQKIMSFSEFADRFLVPDSPPQIGYLAQYDLFHQIPTLRDDIDIPEYCYSAPPTPKGAAALTKGLDTAPDTDQPFLNAWLGPKGTKSPLHTDPYHNILCQVVGYKYVRLYAPEETQYLYPRSVDEAGIDMSNTSSVDISAIRPRGVVSDELRAKRDRTRTDFPLLNRAKFEEALLGPGESLYIPLGWWHYVESLSTSISVSFWFN